MRCTKGQVRHGATVRCTLTRSAPNENAPSKYRKTLAGVREVIRTLPPDLRVHALVILFDAPVNQDVFSGFSNGDQPQKTPLRKWRLSDRARLIQMSLDED